MPLADLGVKMTNTSSISTPQRFLHDIDPQFLRYFQGRLRQVFLYITDHCQLHCKQCLYKPSTTFHMGTGYIAYDDAYALISDFRLLGASKLTIMGGEPSLYGAHENHRPLMNLISASRDLGYKYIRIDTNGQFAPSFLDHPELALLDEISFSLDGHTPALSDCLRGPGAYAKCVENIRAAVAHGYTVDVTTCVHRKLAEQSPGGEYPLHEMILFAEGLGVRRINFHVLFKHGFPMDTWTDETDITWSQWVPLHSRLLRHVQSGSYSIEVRLPQHFVSPREFQRHPKYYSYCPVKLGERILAHPDGILRICSGLISSQYGVGRFFDKRISWDNSGTNETRDHIPTDATPCTNQCKSMDAGNLFPLCFSFKPRQQEIVWDSALSWENQRNDA
jgi:molybdenum cofactor biosynthesis enzyme MoaA